jgi:hypothetical protein
MCDRCRSAEHQECGCESARAVAHLHLPGTTSCTTATGSTTVSASDRINAMNRLLLMDTSDAEKHKGIDELGT